MRIKGAGLCLAILLGGGLAAGQETPAPAAKQPDLSYRYCSGFVSDQKVSDEMHIISGEQSSYKIVFAQGEYVYINRGMNQGVKVGDEFSVMRPIKDPLHQQWFQWQNRLMRAMGTVYEDEGRIKVVKVQPKTSIAEVVFSCRYMQRGDIIRPFEERPAPPFKDAAKFDHFAPASGKQLAMVVVVSMTNFQQMAGQNDTIYVNLGSGQGVKVGDYFRIFRYQGTRDETAYVTRNYQYQVYGFGGTTEQYGWKDLPREVIGEGIVLNASRNSSTVLITFTSSPVYAGDYVEVE